MGTCTYCGKQATSEHSTICGACYYRDVHCGGSSDPFIGMVVVGCLVVFCIVMLMW